MVLIWILPENAIVSGAFVLTVPLTRIVFVEVRLAPTAKLSPHSRPPTTPMRRNDRTEASKERRVVMVVSLKRPSAECQSAARTSHPAGLESVVAAGL